MGKRSNLARRERGFYPTPEAAVLPLVPHLPREVTSYWEPCAGDGALIRALGVHWKWGTCTRASDLVPQADFIDAEDALSVSSCTAAMIITNPPWPELRRGGDPALGLMRHMIPMRPSWWLLAADFAHNVYFRQVEARCHAIVSVGRVSWMGNGTGGYDNAAWYGFTPDHRGATLFWGRADG